jgi:hypothetical protein
MKYVDELIDGLRKEHYTHLTDDMQFKNMYKLDKRFSYHIDKKKEKVTVHYQEITYEFDLPVMTINLAPAISYLLFFKKRYVHKVINTFKLEYKLAIHYSIVLNTHIKNQKAKLDKWKSTHNQ